ncbi:MAG: hypothetical protein HKN22_02695 [Bacteroidia bacterium]|nr:hypothetical protein [Bacteroidia bacterium]
MDISNTLTPLEDGIFKELSKFCDRAHKDLLYDGQWTSGIKELVVKIVHEKGYLACTSGDSKAEWGEWLYDLVLYSFTPFRKSAQCFTHVLPTIEKGFTNFS